ncbi:histone acetyltransferase [Brevibacterium sp. UMB1308A]|uniref:histone acetyltransferase n=1 Tax=Brevibacterium sp. UMB1308A TaxID=3050608 RepID=UPI00254C9EDD|nr:histone acetyltransferase [Brevibacterium sp. UMB1308A]MDK8345514.1 histone acetyltransferase [Brevibacterium sp. UMB1308B]MDK8712641.1 histone acetyltransferase [Brevibacterium sp. UMB1308A]
MMTIRPFAPGDDLALNNILSDPNDPAHHMLRSLVREDSDSAPVTRTVVAEVASGVLVGVAVCAQSPAHPQRAWFHTEVARELDGEEAAEVSAQLREKLSHAVSGTVLEGLPLRTRVGVGAGSSGGAGVGSAGAGSADGDTELFRTRIVRVETLALGGLGADRLDDFVVTATGSVELTRAFSEWYTGVNRADPAASMTLGEFNRRFLSEATGAHGAAMFKRDGQVNAFAVSYPPEQSAEGDAPQESSEATELTVGVMADAVEPRPERDSAEYQAALGDAGALIARLSTDTDVVVEVTSEMPVLTELIDGLVQAGKAHVLYEYATLGSAPLNA